MDATTLHKNAQRTANIFNAVATYVLIVGGFAAVVGFVQSVLESDDVLVGILAGLLVALAIVVYVMVAWALVQLGALVAGYIQHRTT